MITRNSFFLVALLGFFSGVHSDMKCPGVAHYTLSFTAMWSNDTHPNAFPSGGHFSPWVGASHNMYYTMWDAGMEASKGVEDVAETGNSTALKAEINMRIMYNKTAWKLIEQTQAGGPTEIAVEVTADYPLVSVVSMLVPSPDWFVGIRGVNLCDGGMWRDSWDITSLQPWDAGTENGSMFTTNNTETDPVEDITLITKDTAGTPFMGPNDIATLGRLMFKRVNKPMVYSCSGEQKYKLTFKGTWSETRQPVTTFPENAHFSPLIGCTHKYNYKFWSPMTMASQGVKEVAETGKETTLYNELKTVMGKNKYVFDVFKADAKTEPTATSTIIVTAKDMYSKVSFIAMIAPSPDWFVGVDSVELCGSDGNWKEIETAIALPAWDAGTDSGTTFEADDMETMPRDVIRQITKESNTELKGEDDINTFAEVTFTKTSGSGGISISLFAALLAILRFLF